MRMRIMVMMMMNYKLYSRSILRVNKTFIIRYNIYSMVYLFIRKITEKDLKNIDEDTLPVAIIKSDDKKNPLHGQYLCVNTKLKGKKKKRAIELPDDCRFDLIPNVLDGGIHRTVWYIAGPSGVGKSWIAKDICSYYKKMFPGRKIFCVSQLDKDDTLDQIGGLIRIDIDDMVENQPDINTLNNCAIIIDDIEGLKKKQSEAVHTFVTDILTMGRSHCLDDNGDSTQGNISLFYISHNTSNYKKSRQLLTESHYKIFYPYHTAVNQIYRPLKCYIGFDSNQLKRYRKMPICRKRKWVGVHSKFPFFMISAYRCELVDVN